MNLQPYYDLLYLAQHERQSIPPIPVGPILNLTYDPQSHQFLESRFKTAREIETILDTPNDLPDLSQSYAIIMLPLAFSRRTVHERHQLTQTLQDHILPGGILLYSEYYSNAFILGKQQRLPEYHTYQLPDGTQRRVYDALELVLELSWFTNPFNQIRTNHFTHPKPPKTNCAYQLHQMEAPI